MCQLTKDFSFSLYLYILDSEKVALIYCIRRVYDKPFTVQPKVLTPVHALTSLAKLLHKILVITTVIAIDSTDSDAHKSCCPAVEVLGPYTVYLDLVKPKLKKKPHPVQGSIHCLANLTTASVS